MIVKIHVTWIMVNQIVNELGPKITLPKYTGFNTLRPKHNGRHFTNDIGIHFLQRLRIVIRIWSKIPWDLIAYESTLV